MAQELAKLILAARAIDDRYGGIVELLALIGQRREEVAKLAWACWRRILNALAGR
jgi:hypothetical protein